MQERKREERGRFGRGEDLAVFSYFGFRGGLCFD